MFKLFCCCRKTTNHKEVTQETEMAPELKLGFVMVRSQTTENNLKKPIASNEDHELSHVRRVQKSNTSTFYKQIHPLAGYRYPRKKSLNSPDPDIKNPTN